jgi:hypothetical protein
MNSSTFLLPNNDNPGFLSCDYLKLLVYFFYSFCRVYAQPVYFWNMFILVVWISYSNPMLPFVVGNKWLTVFKLDFGVESA